jgi:16S rRNA processing protein RimM
LTEPLLEVGRILRPHGLKGEVVVDLFTDRTERLDPGTELQTDAGVMTVQSSRPHQGRWLVVFEGCADRSDAERLTGRVLRAEAVDEPDALWVHDLVGAEVVEVDGTRRGVVVAVVANPADDLLELDSGALVPERFVVSLIDGVATVDAPEGLFDL